MDAKCLEVKARSYSVIVLTLNCLHGVLELMSIPTELALTFFTALILRRPLAPPCGSSLSSVRSLL